MVIHLNRTCNSCNEEANKIFAKMQLVGKHHSKLLNSSPDESCSICDRNENLS
jgi:hypothetical protein